MNIDQSKKVIKDLSCIVNDLNHKNIFHMISDFKSLSQDIHGVLPELQDLDKSEAIELLESSYELVRALLAVFAGK